METKQVIIIRRKICGGRGKEISMGAHASMGALLDACKDERSYTDLAGKVTKSFCLTMEVESPVYHWLNNSFTKITVSVETEQELLDLEQKAKEAGLPHALITDNGKTVFHGVPTKTALAIGPWWGEDIDKITKHLPLY